jgi:hypothetical protein
MLNPQTYPHSCAQIAAKSSATCDGQISYKNDESNKQMKTQLLGKAGTEKADYAPPPEE